MPPWMIGCSILNSSVIAVFMDVAPIPVASALVLQASRSMDDFQQPGRTHAATDAHRHNGIFGLAAASFDQGMPGQAGPRHAVGMPNRNRSAVDVELFGVDPELVAAMD